MKSPESQYLGQEFFDGGRRLFAAHPQDLSQLSQAFHTGKLRILVGAGLSTEAGLPTWGALMTALMDEFLQNESAQQLSSRMKKAVLRESLRWSTTEIQELIQRIGPTAVADLVRRVSGPQKFLTTLSQALYGQSHVARSFIEATSSAASSAFHQLASMAWHHALSHPKRTEFLYTTNYDALLEHSVVYVGSRRHAGTAPLPVDHLYFIGHELHDATATKPAWLQSEHYPKVRHLHGCVLPMGDGKVGRSVTPLVVTEGDYYRALHAENDYGVREQWDSAIGSPGESLLILGMSLGDPILRARLLRLVEGGADTGAPHNIYVVLKRGLGHVDSVVESFFSEHLHVRCIMLDTWGHLPWLLRQVRFKNNTDAHSDSWVQNSITWAKECRPVGGVGAAEAAHVVLRCARHFLRRRFAIASEEVIELEVLLPVPSDRGPLLEPVASTRSKFDVAESRISFSMDGAQGIAGMSFQSGVVLSGIGAEGGVGRGFNAKLMSAWGNAQGLREDSSVLAIPILSTIDWVPVAVICIRSNRRTPFWECSFTSQQRRFLEKFVRSIPDKIWATSRLILTPDNPRQKKPVTRKSSAKTRK